MLAKCGAVGLNGMLGCLLSGVRRGPLAKCRLHSNAKGASTPARYLTAAAVAAARHFIWQPCYRAVLVDAAGTFLMPSEPITDVYLRYARPHGCRLSDNEVLQRFRRAYNTPWGTSSLRYVGDARPFWQNIVEQSTGCNNPEVSEAIYEYYSRAEAWYVTPGAVEALQRLKSAGLLLAVVSNFDTRLRPLLRELGVEKLFDAVIVSAEVHAEKPNPVIFDTAVRTLSAAAVTRGTAAMSGCGSPLAPAAAQAAAAQRGGAIATDFAPLFPEQVVHIGDDRRNDCWGARDAGLTAWHWGYDVRSWEEVADRVLLGSQVDDYYDDLSYAAQA
ncbi:hypothetical protein Agub_g15610 [Astrephomene gubernaculifera]|uniref:Haloacid dehalogenase-like hydrolase domain-containing protein 3 n=1 Tax=Astrephomene gubernaculifera TaxID=47775 RepID=A0AAD3E3V2_9CHLO|nr:hypothetical protein Agub_g15610 [Astrephomene gubernaculifera]